jgi:hypothetical protein
MAITLLSSATKYPKKLAERTKGHNKQKKNKKKKIFMMMMIRLMTIERNEA